MKLISFAVLVGFIVSPFGQLFSQSEGKSNFLKKLGDWKVKPTAFLQFWATYTHGMEVFDAEHHNYEAVDDRLNFTLHRARYSLSMEPYNRLDFNVTVAMDFVGRDVLSALDPGQNNGANPIIRLWQTYFQWQVTKDANSPKLTFGYFPTRVGRESMTNPCRVTSMEKAWSQNYIRRQLTGIGPGRAVGVNFGGQTWKEGDLFSIKYDIGLHTPVSQAYGGNSTGKQASPLGVSRVVLMIGQPESKTYSFGNKVNYFGSRKGVSFAVEGAAQGTTDLFKNNMTVGADMLLNYGQFNLDGEWYYFSRKAESGNSAHAQTGHIRASLNFPLQNGFVVEPAAMFVEYRGEMQAEAQLVAESVGMPSGEDQHFDFGVNFYFNPDLKLALHYTIRSGQLGEKEAGSTVNNYFVTGAGPVRYGNWIGLGLTAVL